jgi:predicted site-specific integrase-resolvase
MSYDNEQQARADNLCRPLTIAEVVARTGRSLHTVNRWIRDGHLRTIRLENPPETVVIEREVVELERTQRQRLNASRKAIGDRARSQRREAS